jgi:GNAT superfamily N-acetyltransferase
MLAGSKNCIAYFALQIGSDAVPDTPREKASYLQNYTAFPAVHLSSLAVDVPYQRQGLGTYLLMDIFDRVAAISEHVGFYALTLQSFDVASTAFYESLGFAAYTDGPQPKMLYPLETILATVKAGR